MNIVTSQGQAAQNAFEAAVRAETERLAELVGSSSVSVKDLQAELVEAQYRSEVRRHALSRLVLR